MIHVAVVKEIYGVSKLVSVNLFDDKIDLFLCGNLILILLMIFIISFDGRINVLWGSQFEIVKLF